VHNDEHFLTVCRHVERNSLPAMLVNRAENEAWCSLACREKELDETVRTACGSAVMHIRCIAPLPATISLVRCPRMRCFVAIELSSAVRARLADLQKRLAPLDRDVRWTRPEQIHLTVKFLGEVPDGDVPGVCDVAAQIASGYAPFEIEVRGTGCFPPRGSARIVWAGLGQLPNELVDCHREIEQAYAKIGFKPEDRPFHPHLTIGRVRDPRGSHAVRPVVDQQQQFAGGTVAVNELLVFQSILESSGPTHIVLSRAPLCGPA
jgi:RNA 2',3'-cyclic 3'-phosphodiesterase